jgi:hypothetical protein
MTAPATRKTAGDVEPSAMMEAPSGLIQYNPSIALLAGRCARRCGESG